MIPSLQNEVDQQKSVAQSKLDDFLTQQSTKKNYWTAWNVQKEHGFHVPAITPSASSESSLNTMPVPSPDLSVYKTADEFLNNNFPVMALGSSGNLTVVSDDKD